MVSFLQLTMLQLGGEVKLMKEATVEVVFEYFDFGQGSKHIQMSHNLMCTSKIAISFVSVR